MLAVVTASDVKGCIALGYLFAVQPDEPVSFKVHINQLLSGMRTEEVKTPNTPTYFADTS